MIVCSCKFFLIFFQQTDQLVLISDKNISFSGGPSRDKLREEERGGDWGREKVERSGEVERRWKKRKRGWE